MTPPPPSTADTPESLGLRLNKLGSVGRALHGLYYLIPGLHRRPEALFVIGHMRSGSTLLAHLLVAHDEIAGYGEAHLSYRSALDRLRLRLHVFVRHPQARVTQTYVMDKIVNEVFEFDPAVLRSPRTRAVLLLREPVASLESLHRILPEWSEGAVLEHYLERVRALETCAATLAGTGRALALTHDELVGDPERTLGALTRWLGLQTPLRDAYAPTLTTGQWGWGDTTERIWAGRVVRPARPASDAEAPSPTWVSEETRGRAEAAHASCLDHLRRVALSVDDFTPRTPDARPSPGVLAAP